MSASSSFIWPLAPKGASVRVIFSNAPSVLQAALGPGRERAFAYLQLCGLLEQSVADKLYPVILHDVLLTFVPVMGKLLNFEALQELVDLHIDACLDSKTAHPVSWLATRQLPELDQLGAPLGDGLLINGDERCTLALHLRQAFWQIGSVLGLPPLSLLNRLKEVRADSVRLLRDSNAIAWFAYAYPGDR